jgi:isoquinoline 1-oxidoreductase beta subunit
LFRPRSLTGRLGTAVAQKWNVPANECKAQLGFVVHIKSGKKAGFGEIAAAAKLPVPDKATLKFKPEPEYRYEQYRG